ncbi:MAG: hypothetical protein HC789_12105 [Microcoleus sp. CSU_2_2]|nr:hypothetical protein [Microcoleus sp. CSU_2_2]
MNSIDLDLTLLASAKSSLYGIRQLSEILLLPTRQRDRTHCTLLIINNHFPPFSDRTPILYQIFKLRLLIALNGRD